jgi:hypothetical protein
MSGVTEGSCGEAFLRSRGFFVRENLENRISQLKMNYPLERKQSKGGLLVRLDN